MSDTIVVSNRGPLTFRTGPDGSLVPVPAFGPRLLLGSEGAAELAQASQRVVPVRLHDTGHAFRHGELEACLRHQPGHLPAPA